METEVPEKNERETTPTDMDWEHRVLCSDGNCIGVIGPDGHCKECGEKFEGTLPEDHFSETSEPSSEDNSFEPEDQSEPSLENMSQEVAENDNWQDRVLCSDGNCIGVIGTDGRCKECGKPYEREG
jgi:hypothetical protein